MRTKNAPVSPAASRPYTLYLLECRGGKFYAGIAIDAEDRFMQHLSGKGAAYTRANPPEVILASREYPDKGTALRAEYALKQLPKTKKLDFFHSGPTMNPTRIYPVIHYYDWQTTMQQIGLARSAGADGAFLISHRFNDAELVQVAEEARALYPDWRIGLNLLTRTAEDAAHTAVRIGMNMVWADDMGVSSGGVSPSGLPLCRLAQEHRGLEFFASVAFKYQEVEVDPPEAARQAVAVGFTPTTSGSGTGRAPDIQKIRSMSEAVGGKLAIASGMTPDNVQLFAPHLESILVATGIGLDEHRIDLSKLDLLLSRVRATSRAVLATETA